MMLARLLASMKDDDGRVLVDGFYDGIEPLERDRAAGHRRGAGRSTRELMRELWLGATEGGAADADRADHAAVAQHPRHGELAHRRAGVERDSRDGDGVDRHPPGEGHGSGAGPAERVIEHIRKQGFFVVDRTRRRRRCAWRIAKVARVDRAAAATTRSRTSMDLPISQT